MRADSGFASALAFTNVEALSENAVGGSFNSLEGLLAEGFGQESELQGSPQQLSNVAHVQSPHQIKAVNFHRSHANLQHVRDFTIRVADRYQAKDVALSRCQQVEVDGLIDKRFRFSS
jgi:hypothetical protein